MNKEEKKIFDLVRLELRDELRSEHYRHKLNSLYCGHCHHATVSMYYLLGGKKNNYKIKKAVDELEITHYWLETKDGEIIDPTAEQYTDFGRKLPYNKALNRGVSYRKTKAALEIIAQVTKKLENG